MEVLAANRRVMDSGILSRHQIEFDLLTGKQKKLVAYSTLEATKSLFEIRKHKNESKRLTHKITISSQEARSTYLWLERASPLNETQSDSEEQSEGSHYEDHEGLDSSEDAQSDIPATHDMTNETTGVEHEGALVTGAPNESQELHADTALRLNPFRDDDTLDRFHQWLASAAHGHEGNFVPSTTPSLYSFSCGEPSGVGLSVVRESQGHDLSSRDGHDVEGFQ